MPQSTPAPAATSDLKSDHAQALRLLPGPEGYPKGPGRRPPRLPGPGYFFWPAFCCPAASLRQTNEPHERSVPPPVGFPLRQRLFTLNPCGRRGAACHLRL